jgi:hypothetical protein
VLVEQARASYLVTPDGKTLLFTTDPPSAGLYTLALP